MIVSVWDWSNPKAYLHDEIATDKRNPTVNPYGKLYGAPEYSTDLIPVLDPIRNTAVEMKMPVRDPKTPSSKEDPIYAPSMYWGEERLWDSQAAVHNPMFDEKGRVWFTSRIRPSDNPAFCKKGSEHPSAKLTPVNSSGRQLSMYDPKTGKFTLVNTCYGTHHLVFAEDANNTLWTSGGGGAGVVGWLNTKMLEETGDEEKSQGWTALILDTNGNGKRDDYVGPKDPIDPDKGQTIAGELLRRGMEPGGRFGVGLDPSVSRSSGSAEPGTESTAYRSGRSLRSALEGLQAPGAGIRSTRDGYRSPRRCLDRAVEWPSREL